MNGPSPAAAGLKLPGERIREVLTYLGLVLSGAWVLADIWQAVTEDHTRGCSARAADLRHQCVSWGKGKAAWQRACCFALVSQGEANCRSRIPHWPPMPWEDPDNELCVAKFYPERP